MSLTFYQDILSIPDVVKTPAGITWGIAMGLLPFLFAASIATEQARLINDEKPEFNKVIYNTIVIVLCLTVYRYLFNKIVAFCEGTAMSLFNYKEWAAFTTVLNEVQKKSGFINLLSFTAVDVLHYLCLVLMLAIETVFDVVRFVILSALYIIGPLSFAFYIFKPTRTFLRGWLLSTFQVAFWIVVLRVFQSVLLSFKVYQNIGKSDDPITTIVLCGATLILTMLTPFITGTLLNGGSIGSAGSAIIAGAVYLSSIARVKRGSGRSSTYIDEHDEMFGRKGTPQKPGSTSGTSGTGTDTGTGTPSPGGTPTPESAGTSISPQPKPQVKDTGEEKAPTR